VNRDNKTRLEADYCTLEDECRRVLSWTQGLAVLRIQ
jgi:hypothetical protein